MRPVLLTAVFLLAARAAAPAGVAYKNLPPGRYRITVRGMVCTVCARAIAAEWAKVPDVEKVAADFDHEYAIVTVRLEKNLPVSTLDKVLRRAEKLANMGTRYSIGDVEYIP